MSIEGSIRPENFLKLYLKEIGQTPLLSAQEELSLAVRGEMGRCAQVLLGKMGVQVSREALNGDGNPELLLQGGELRLESWNSLIEDQKALPKEERLTREAVWEIMEEWGLVCPEMDTPELLEIVRAGFRADNYLLKANLLLPLKWIFKRSDQRQVEILDLIQDVNLRLLERGIPGFEFWQGNRLSTYLTYAIKSEIRSSFARKHMSPIPRYKLEEIGALTLELWQKKGTTHLTVEDFAEAMGLTPKKVEKLFRLMRLGSIVSLDQDQPFDDSEAPLYEFVGDRNAPNPEQEVSRQWLFGEIESFLNKLPAREALVLRLHYGIPEGESRHTFEEISQHLGLSDSWVRILERQALKRLETSRALREYVRWGYNK